MDKVKAIFRAQYLHQCVYADNLHNEPYELKYISGADDGCYLLLRSIKDLTDEEFAEIGRLYYSQLNLSDNRLHELEYISEGKRIAEGLYKRYALACCTTIAAYQYLLRIGILLPFTYLDEENKPVTIQPDEIIQLGWAKYIN